MPEEGSWLCKAGPGSAWLGVVRLIWCGLVWFGVVWLASVKTECLQGFCHLIPAGVPCTFRTVVK